MKVLVRIVIGQDNRHNRREGTVRLEHARREETIKRNSTRSQDNRPARRDGTVKLEYARRERTVKPSNILPKERLRSRGGRSALRRQSQSLLGLLYLAEKAARLVVWVGNLLT